MYSGSCSKFADCMAFAGNLNAKDDLHRVPLVHIGLTAERTELNLDGIAEIHVLANAKVDVEVVGGVDDEVVKRNNSIGRSVR